MMTKTNETGAEMGIEVVMPREGGPEVLEVARRDAPRRPKAGEAVVRVEATGVSFAEVQMLKGRYFMQPKFPFVPGYDLVGEVESVGEGVDGGLVGQRVAALTQTGSWADRVALDAKNLAPVPDGLDSADAVAAVTNGVTAWQMIHRAASVRPGQTVLVHGASGGVGTLLVQLARLAGAEVIGTASASKHEHVRALGAIPIDYRGEDVPQRVREISPGGLDAVFDHVGGPGLVDSWRMLRRGGTLVTYGSASTLGDTGHRLKPYLPIVGQVLLWSAMPNGKRATFYYVQRWPKLFKEDLSTVLSLLAEGKIEAHVDRRLPLERAAEALGLLVSGKVSGKVVLMPGLGAESRLS
ncbi:MAG: Quinone oxidoreductase [uncultured Rubrobacteraceae bacterium]|uniref:Quinone oxidoreductase n=1 Tax=uncultured Rubrobacteraceae bacterium TaxID=349277 RepID=A0A6J4QPD6_9ACTN|nr:MAG: Quinone oxidoreductase [uncultured Rubrobacteraceae bacterium]